jgi:hypothetical protein
VIAVPPGPVPQKALPNPLKYDRRQPRLRRPGPAPGTAARHRGDLASAHKLLDGLDDRQKAAWLLFLADLAVALVPAWENRPVDDVAANLK